MNPKTGAVVAAPGFDGVVGRRGDARVLGRREEDRLQPLRHGPGAHARGDGLRAGDEDVLEPLRRRDRRDELSRLARLHAGQRVGRLQCSTTRPTTRRERRHDAAKATSTSCTCRRGRSRASTCSNGSPTGPSTLPYGAEEQTPTTSRRCCRSPSAGTSGSSSPAAGSTATRSTTRSAAGLAEGATRRSARSSGSPPSTSTTPSTRARSAHDISHPPFYLRGQELAGGNSRGFWALEPVPAERHRLHSAATSAAAGTAGSRAGADGGPIVLVRPAAVRVRPGVREVHAGRRLLRVRRRRADAMHRAALRVPRRSVRRRDQRRSPLR